MKQALKQYIEDNRPYSKAKKNSALSSTEEDSLQDEYDLHDYREQQAQDNGGCPE